MPVRWNSGPRCAASPVAAGLRALCVAALAACAKGLRFSRSFGGNWDALADCLKDLGADLVANLRNCEPFADAAPDDYATALEVFQDAADFWRERGSIFVVLVDVEPEDAKMRRFGG